MTRTISLITATVGAALLFAVPALSGNYDRYRMFGPGEHAVAANDDQTVSGNYDRYRMFGPGEHAVAANDDQTVSGNYDRYRMFGPGEHAVAANDDQTVSGAVMSPDSGTQIEWPQLGIGLGIGILLVLGLGLAMRITHVRPFAH
jgi:gamma-glutamylcyclotransferase (GGCT)/AIG2-like uncharacterized protein YtfP